MTDQLSFLPGRKQGNGDPRKKKKKKINGKFLHKSSDIKLTQIVSQPKNLDPTPWWVGELETRYSHRDIVESARDQEGCGTTLYELAEWKPRPGYPQHQDDYS